MEASSVVDEESKIHEFDSTLEYDWSILLSDFNLSNLTTDL